MQDRSQWKQDYTEIVRSFISIVAAFVMFIMMLPALACAASSTASRSQQDCCEQMRGRCGEMAKQGCCKLEVRNDLQQFPGHLVAAPILPLTITLTVYPVPGAPTAFSGYQWHIPDEHSPPGLLIVSTTVLRI